MACMKIWKDNQLQMQKRLFLLYCWYFL